MFGLRYNVLAALTLATFALSAGRADEPRTKQTTRVPTPKASAATRAPHADAAPATCTIYALSDLGDDGQLGQWLASTIPDVIHPGSWTRNVSGTCLTGSPSVSGERRVVSYFAPAKLLVVYHTSTVQSEVAAFLANVKKALPQEPKRGSVAKFAPPIDPTTTEPGVLPASFNVPSALRPVVTEPLTQPPALPSASTAKPKHLFHFIIRYEGDGIIDANVVELFKSYGTDSARNNNCGVPSYSMTPPGVVPNGAAPMLPPGLQQAVFTPAGPPPFGPMGLPILPPGLSVAPISSPVMPPSSAPPTPRMPPSSATTASSTTAPSGTDQSVSRQLPPSTAPIGTRATATGPDVSPPSKSPR